MLLQSACRRCPELLLRERLVALSNSPLLRTPKARLCSSRGPEAVGGDGKLVGVLSVRHAKVDYYPP